MFQDVSKVSLGEQILQVLAFFLVGFFGEHQRHSAIGTIFPPGMTLFSFEGGIKFPVGERVDADFISPVFEFCEDVGRKHTGVAAGNIEIYVFQLHKSQKDIHKSNLGFRIIHIGVLDIGNLLYLIKKHIILLRLV